MLYRNIGHDGHCILQVTLNDIALLNTSS